MPRSQGLALGLIFKFRWPGGSGGFLDGDSPIGAHLPCGVPETIWPIWLVATGTDRLATWRIASPATRPQQGAMPGHRSRAVAASMPPLGRNPTDWHPARHVAQTFHDTRAWATEEVAVVVPSPACPLVWWPPACISLAPMFSKESSKLDFLGRCDAVIDDVGAPKLCR